MIRIFGILFWVSLTCFAENKEPIPKRTVIIAVDSFSDRWLPSEVAGTFNNWVLLHVGRRLLNSHFSDSLAGDLASSWQIGPDKNTIIFKFNEDLGNFCDGTAVTAELIGDSLMSAKKQSKNGRLGFFYDAITAIKKTKNELNVTFNSNASQWMRFFSDPATTIYKSANGRELPCFSGAYSLDSADRHSVNLSRRSDGLKFKLIALPFEQATQQMTKGAVHVITTYSYYQNRILESFEKSLVVRDGKVYFFAINSQSPRFRSKSNRLALFDCINSKKLNSFLENNKVDLRTSFVSTEAAMQTASLSQGKKCIPKRFAKVKVLIQAGHKMDQIVEAAFGEKFFFQIESFQKEKFISTIQKSDFDLVAIGLSMVSRDYGSLARLFENNNIWNLAKMAGKNVDAQLQKLHSTESLVQKSEAFLNLEKISLSEGYYFPFGYQATSFGFSKNVKMKPGLSDAGGRGASIFLNLDDILGLE